MLESIQAWKNRYLIPHFAARKTTACKNRDMLNSGGDLMELYQLEQFVAVAEAGSMGKAAERLFISRAAISQSIKRLEQELDCELFTREHNKITITAYGEILLDRARAAMGELSAARGLIEQEKAAHDAVVRVAHFSMPLCFFRMPHLAREFPSLNFVVELCDEGAALAGLRNGEFDMAIVSAHGDMPKGATAIRLDVERACLSVPPASPLFGCDSLRLEDIAQETVFIADDLLGSTRWYRDMAERAGIAPERIVSVPADEYLSSMSGNDLCHFSTLQMVDFFGLGNGRRAVPLEGEGTEREVVALVNPESLARLDEVIAYLRERKSAPFDAYDILPFLVFPGAVTNLQVIA